MKLLILYWSFMIIGYIIADRSRKKGMSFSWVQPVLMICIYILCLIMGLRMGVNEQVTSNLGIIGLKSLVVTIFAVAGSIGAITITRKILGMDRYGNTKKQLETAGGVKADEEESNSVELKSTIIILTVVAIGMVLGAFVLSGPLSMYLESFDSTSYIALVVLITILLFFVGFDLGASGTVFSYLKEAGIKVVIFPVVAVIGTIILGTASCMLMGFSIKEGTAISIGFGWYTYAPVVIAGAGQQYMIASAVSFMHNVIRETAAIILIPVVAKKIGYLETAGFPGVAAMDVCMPIVERSCRPDTVIYSFATGLLMCLVTSAGVPLVMGL